MNESDQSLVHCEQQGEKQDDYRTDDKAGGMPFDNVHHIHDSKGRAYRYQRRGSEC